MRTRLLIAERESFRREKQDQFSNLMSLAELAERTGNRKLLVRCVLAVEKMLFPAPLLNPDFGPRMAVGEEKT